MRFFIILTIFIFTGCKPYKFEDKKLIDTIPASEIKHYLKQINNSKNELVYGLRVYQLVYKVKVDSKDINASAIVVVPSKDGTDEQSLIKLEEIKKLGFATIIDNHSTIIDKEKAPSIAIRNYNIPKSAILFSALNGFITLMPDYIGFGSSSSLTHPYLINKFYQENSISLIKAYKNFCNLKNIKVDFKKALFMIGYSEGGYASLNYLSALNKKGYHTLLTIAGAAPYILDEIALYSFKSNKKKSTTFIAYVIYSYAKYYKDVDLKNIVKRKYLSKFKNLFDLNLTKEEIKNSLPTSLIGKNGLLKDSFIHNFKNSTLYKHLKYNSLNGIKVDDNIKLFHCKHDTLIPYTTSQKMKENLLKSGATVALKNLEINLYNQKTDHKECGVYTYIIASKIFSNLRLVLLGY